MSELSKKKEISLPVKMLIALILGSIAGVVIGKPITNLKFLGDIFVRLLTMCIYPLVLVSIIQGISQVRDMARLKKVGIGFFWYWLLSGAVIGVVGVVVSMLMKPGVGVNLSLEGTGVERVEMNFIDNLVSWIPSNPFASMANGDVLQIIVVALIFGIILAAMPNGPKKDQLVGLIDAANDWVADVIGAIIKIAPIGVFCMMANTVATVGGTSLAGIFKMLMTLYITFFIMYLVVYPLILCFVAKLNPIQFYKNLVPVLIMAFSTCSSNATIPVTMDCAKKRMGVPDDIVNLITAPAATLNMHANCLETPLFCIFAAQLYNLDLSPSQLFITIILGLISAIGSAGVPGGGILMITLVLQVMNLPLTIVPWIIGVYTFIDMPGTMSNVAGDVLGMCVVATRLGELDKDVFNGRKGEKVAA